MRRWTAILALCAAGVGSAAHSQAVVNVEQEVRGAHRAFLGPCLTWIETGAVTQAGGFAQVGRKAKFQKPRADGQRGWRAEISLETRRRQRECKLRVQGALFDQSQINALGAALERMVGADPRATPVGSVQVRGTSYPAFRIGTGIYRFSMLSGGKNTDTSVYLIHVGDA